MENLNPPAANPLQPTSVELDHSKTPNPQTPPPTPLKTPDVPTSSQLLPKHHNFPLHKALLIAAVTLGIIFLTAYVGVYYLLNQQLDKITKARNNVAPTTTPISKTPPTPTIGFPSGVTTSTADWKTYTTKKLGYSFKYPASYFTSESEGDGRITIRKTDNKDEYPLISIDPKNVEEVILTNETPRATSFTNTSGLNFKDYSEKILLAIFDASGAAAEQYSSKITKIEPFKTASGIDGFEVYPNLISETFAPGSPNPVATKKEEVIGPVYTLDISSLSSVRGLFIVPKWPMTAAEMIEFTPVLKGIAESISFPQQAQVACTQEAKQCSDGSYVSRTGPNCEFTPCPQ